MWLFLKAAKGGFFSVKKPLEFMASVYCDSENALTRPSSATDLSKSL